MDAYGRRSLERTAPGPPALFYYPGRPDPAAPSLLDPDEQDEVQFGTRTKGNGPLASSSEFRDYQKIPFSHPDKARQNTTAQTLNKWQLEQSEALLQQTFKNAKQRLQTFHTETHKAEKIKPEKFLVSNLTEEKLGEMLDLAIQGDASSSAVAKLFLEINNITPDMLKQSHQQIDLEQMRIPPKPSSPTKKEDTAKALVTLLKALDNAGAFDQQQKIPSSGTSDATSTTKPQDQDLQQALWQLQQVLLTNSTSSSSR
uniref:Uncharacterized protein n=2 Tax=Heterosigma akashiwo TaxID=2829 RepID=A0A7S4DK35_HETAK